MYEYGINVCTHISLDLNKSNKCYECILSHFSHALLFATLGILQARILEWFSMPSFRGSS